MSKREPDVLLDDVRSSINKIERYTVGLNEASFLADEKTIDAVVRNLEIIGEAAKQLPAEFDRAAQPAGPYPTERCSSTPVALANMFPPGILFPMLRRAGNASNQMTDTVEIESAPYFSINQVTHKGRFASFLGGGATS